MMEFTVDAEGCDKRHSGIRLIVPTGRVLMPMRITCRYLSNDRLIR